MSKQKLPYIPQTEEIIRFFNVIDLPKACIIFFLTACCGLRISEVVKVKTKTDINLEEKTIFIRDAKNTNRTKEGYGKDRIIPLPEIAISPLKKWIEIISDLNTPWLFPSEKSPERPFTIRQLENWFDDYRKKAGLNQIELYRDKMNNKNPLYRFRFHTLRHYYAQRTYEATGDIYMTSQLLGHADLETTSIYAKVSQKGKRQAVDLAFQSPMTKITQRIKEINHSQREKNPIEILQGRLAKGEIDFIMYRRLLAELNPEMIISRET